MHSAPTAIGCIEHPKAARSYYNCPARRYSSRLAAQGSAWAKMALTTATPPAPALQLQQVGGVNAADGYNGDVDRRRYRAHGFSSNRVGVQLGAGHKGRAAAKVVRAVGLGSQRFGSVMGRYAQNLIRPQQARARLAAISLWPTCTPSAPAAKATSTLSSITNGT